MGSTVDTTKAANAKRILICKGEGIID